MIRAYSPVPVGTPISVELKQGDPVAGTVHWVEDELTGVRFEAPIDVVSLLASDITGPQPRLPRIELQCGAWVRQQAQLVRVEIVNVSQGGVCVRSSGPLEIGAQVVATLPGLTPAPGVVKWGKDCLYGIGFNRPFVFSDLVAWLKERQGRAPDRLAS